MKIVVVAVAAMSLMAGTAWEGAAANFSKSPKHHVKRHYPRYAAPNLGNKPKNPDATGWYPHDASQLPFGSARWWVQKQQEGGSNGSAM
jgi:hypothetical protein